MLQQQRAKLNRMKIRTLKQLVLHLQTFRNIQLWYQGIYYLKFTIYMENDKSDKQKKIHAHPFAVTQCNLARKDQSSQLYDSQIVEHSQIVKNESAYYSKAFHLKYFQEQVQLNDLCHFRIQVDTFNQSENPLVMEVGLWFYDSFKKNRKQTKNFKQQSKEVRKVKFIINPFINSQSIHQYVPILFEDQYFSLTKMAIHTINIDHKIRMNSLQLSQFASLSQAQKKALIQKLKTQTTPKRISISQFLRKQLQEASDNKILGAMAALLKQQIRTNNNLISQYKKVFQFSISENQVKYFSEHLIYPRELAKLSQSQEDQAFKHQTQLILLSNNKSQEIQHLQDKVTSVLNLINYAGAKNLKLWQTFIRLLKINPRFSVAFYEFEYRKKQRKFWSNFMRVDNIRSMDITLSYDDNLKTLQEQLQISKSEFIFQTKVYDYKLIQSQASLPLIVVQAFGDREKSHGLYIQGDLFDKHLGQEEQVQRFQGVHLVVLVHGFQGSSYDVKAIKNNISHLFPQSMFLCCTANQDQTDSDIFQMGNRIAMQIKGFIIENFPNNTLGRISFIGHSLGGLKIRAALPKLLEFKQKFFCYISFSSPHLGYKVNASSVIQAGIWILQKMKESQCLKQLTMTDHADPYQSTLYRLSLQQGLQYFKKILLYSSAQDSYAPYQSARIQIKPAFMGSSDPLKSIHCQMVKNILRNIKSQVLHRVHVNFTINTKNLDSFIGRTAHIMFLQTAEVIKSLVYTNQKLFS